MNDKSLNKLKVNIGQLLDEKSFKPLIKVLLKQIKTSEVIFSFILSIILCIILIPVVTSNETILKLKSIVDYNQNISICLFAGLLTGYALFQGIIEKKTLSALLSNCDDMSNLNLFKKYNLNFILTLFVFLFIIILQIILKYSLEAYSLVCTSMDFLKYDSLPKSILLYIILFLYISLWIFCLIQVKSFIYNLYQVFNISTFLIGKEIYKETLNKNDDEQKTGN